ncbi:adenosylcobinamide-GDP ribazoletransferase [Halobacterium sp. R2-5]|uniref:adenosylcobinamide-GDP ribazoletransferase n=1 Tax=Halobacterium sp. R2-5 TaxID=2715751 RepID=UPI00141F366A|nr:adenosylcobinamide-GDP ribazoletransferase [Halobacterium sp. R2-5]
MVVTALRGAIGFLTRLRVGHSEAAWTAFRGSPWAFPLAGYVVGALLAAPFVFADHFPAGTVTLAYLAAVFAVTGINHLDGVADVGDALVVHGDSDERTRVLKDTTVGVGAVAAVALAVAGLALGAFGVARLPTRAALAVVVAAEVGAKLGMASVACLGTAAHEGLGSQFTERAGRSDLLPAVLVALPAVVLSWPTPAAAGALVGAFLAGFVVLWRLQALLDGVNGDVFGAVNEVGRVVGLHLGVVAWTLS